MSGALDFVLGIVAFGGAFFVPPLLALVFWHILAKRAHGWIAHILILPTIALVEWGFGWLIFIAAHDDGAGPPGLGLILIFPFTTSAGSILIYYLCLVFQFLRQLWKNVHTVR